MNNLVSGDLFNKIICGRNQNTLDTTLTEIKKINQNIIGINCDVTEKNNLITLVNEIKNQVGEIDILINNVGGSINREGIEGTPIKDLNKTFVSHTRQMALLQKETILYPHAYLGQRKHHQLF